MVLAFSPMILVPFVAFAALRDSAQELLLKYVVIVQKAAGLLLVGLESGLSCQSDLHLIRKKALTCPVSPLTDRQQEGIWWDYYPVATFTHSSVVPIRAAPPHMSGTYASALPLLTMIPRYCSMTGETTMQVSA